MTARKLVHVRIILRHILIHFIKTGVSVVQSVICNLCLIYLYFFNSLEILIVDQSYVKYFFKLFYSHIFNLFKC